MNHKLSFAWKPRKPISPSICSICTKNIEENTSLYNEVAVVHLFPKVICLKLKKQNKLADFFFSIP